MPGGPDDPWLPPAPVGGVDPVPGVRRVRPGIRANRIQPEPAERDEPAWAAVAAVLSVLIIMVVVVGVVGMLR